MAREVRVGDRYVNGGDKITITRVDGSEVTYAVLQEGESSSWTIRTATPLPPAWRFVASAPPAPLLCPLCQDEEPEPGLLFCFSCATTHAVQCAGMTAEQVKDAVPLLQQRRDETRRE